MTVGAATMAREDVDVGGHVRDELGFQRRMDGQDSSDVMFAEDGRPFQVTVEVVPSKPRHLFSSQPQIQTE